MSRVPEAFFKQLDVPIYKRKYLKRKKRRGVFRKA
jgi:hypothetical protein